jgi:hypothetical protein
LITVTIDLNYYKFQCFNDADDLNEGCPL